MAGFWQFPPTEILPLCRCHEGMVVARPFLTGRCDFLATENPARESLRSADHGHHSRKRFGWSVRLFVGLLVLLCLGSAQGGAPGTIATFRQLRELPKEQATRSLKAHIESIVLCSDAAWGQLYFYDGSEVKWISPLSFQNHFAKGDEVDLNGLTLYLDNAPALTNLQAVVTGQRTLPPPARLRLKGLGTGLGQWVETSGKVRAVDTSWGRLALVIEDAGRSCLIFVMGPVPNSDVKSFLGNKIKVRGINASTLENGQLAKASVFAPDLNEIEVLDHSRMDPNRVQVTVIDKLSSMELGSWTNDIVHVTGTVSSYIPGSSIELKDPTGMIMAEVVQMNRVLGDQRVDLWGFPCVTANGLILKDAFFEPLISVGDLSNRLAIVSETGQDPGEATLTNVSQVIRLSKQRASGQLPVCLRGVITYTDPDWRNLFVQDQTGGVYLDSDQTNLATGQFVEVRGQTRRGGFAPEIKATSVQVLTNADFPSPALVDLTDLANGNLDAHWIQLEGVVRRVAYQWNHLDLTVTTPRGRFRAIVPRVADSASGAKLVDCLVAVQGVCGSQLNTHGQLIGITLQVPSLAQIQILDGVPADPFSVHGTPIASVSLFDPERRAGRRVKISGTVLMVLSRGEFMVQDATGGVRVETSQTNVVRAGDVLDILGFPSMGDFSPSISQAIFKQTGVAHLPEPRHTTAEHILLKGDTDAELIELEAQLDQNASRSARPRLLLRAGNILFPATLVGSGQLKPFPSWRAGSVLRIKGVCSIQGDEAHEPQAFRILVADTNDVTLTKAASWWGLRQTLMALTSLATVVLAAAGWIVLLRRQVRKQTDVLRENHQELLQISRQAGMAEVATSVLHNVGNVLNSINVGATLAKECLRESRLPGLQKLAKLLFEQEGNLGTFLTQDANGKRIPTYISELAQRLTSEQALLLRELRALCRNVEHVKEIVAVQQSYAKMVGVLEKVDPIQLVDDTLRMNSGAFARGAVRINREFDVVPPILTDKHKLLQILINLVQNARHACEESPRSDKALTIRINRDADGINISVRDNGVGIAPENLNKIFRHGFTTRKDGHGFGLHSGALAAKELGGTLTVRSAGAGEGAEFTVSLPCREQ
jgi:signal transduction histidine kinase